MVTNGGNMKLFQKLFASLLIFCLFEATIVQAQQEPTTYYGMYEHGTLGEYHGQLIRIDVSNDKISFSNPYTNSFQNISPNDISSITYTEVSHHRIGLGILLAFFSGGAGLLVALTQSHKYYVTLSWSEDNIKQTMTVRLVHQQYASLLDTLQSITSIQPLYTDFRY